MNRVSVSGIGAVTPLGLSFGDTFESLLSARSGVAPIANDRIATLVPGALAAAVSPTFDARVGRLEAGLDRATQLALAAAREALADAGLGDWSKVDSVLDRARVGVYVGTGLGGAHSLDPLYQRLFARIHGVEKGDAGSMHPLTVPRIMPNAAASWLSIEQGLRGPTSTFTVACSSSAVALGEAVRAIRHGYVDAVVVIGTEAFLTPGAFAAWNALRVMARPDPADVASSCKPFDKNRSGFVLGEGAAALVLEREDIARSRGARSRGIVAGYGISSDASHITLPSRDGQVAAVRQAMNECRLSPSDIQYVNAHGTATAAGDATETESIKEAFGSHAANLAVSSTKSMHGHLIGAGGALEFAIALEAMRTGSLPPTANLVDQDPQCDLDYVPRQARHGAPLSAVMSNSFAFGGTNVSLIAHRAEW